jgi:hypothetical protein
VSARGSEAVVGVLAALVNGTEIVDSIMADFVVELGRAIAAGEKPYGLAGDELMDATTPCGKRS